MRVERRTIPVRHGRGGRNVSLPTRSRGSTTRPSPAYRTPAIAPPDPSPVRVLYVGGIPRSGSTLLEQILGGLPGVLPAGEITHLWRRGLVEDQLCSCGARFAECTFWRRVMARMFEGPTVPSGRRLASLRDSACGFRRLPQLVVPELRTPGYRRLLDAYAERLGGLYRAIRAVSGCDVIIDTSKYPGEALLLRSMGAIDLRLLHLVRDAPAVVHSWRRRKRRPEIHWTDREMPRYPVLISALAWNVFNRVLESIGEDSKTGYARLRYEDLVRNPRDALARVCGLLGREVPPLDFLPPGGVRATGSHSVSGNPCRFRRGRIPLVVDEAWRSGLVGWRRWLVRWLTAAGRRRYGYLRATPPGVGGRT